MRNVLIVMTVFLVLGAAPAMALTQTYDEPGTLAVQGGVGLYWGTLVDVQGGFDYAVYQADLSPEFPLDLGVAGRSLLYNGGVGVGVFGTAHYSWKALRTKMDWLNHLETYVGVGLGILPGLGLDAFGGVSYHFNDHWALYAEGGMGGVLGIQYRF